MRSFGFKMIKLFQITAAIMFHKIFLSEQPEKKENHRLAIAVVQK